MAANHASPGPVRQVEGDGELFVVVPAVSTSIHGDGEVLFDFTEIPEAVRRNGDIGFIKSITVIDKADTVFGVELYVAQAGATLGTINEAASITDANILANRVQHLGDIPSTSFKDLVGSKVATRHDLALMVQAADASRSIWIAGRIVGGTPTFGAATDLVLLVGIMWK